MSYFFVGYIHHCVGPMFGGCGGTVLEQLSRPMFESTAAIQNLVCGTAMGFQKNEQLLCSNCSMAECYNRS